jgi:hypothetical protein
MNTLNAAYDPSSNSIYAPSRIEAFDSKLFPLMLTPQNQPLLEFILSPLR